jgi:ABC-2 type transport system ATP-binding protein
MILNTDGIVKCYKKKKVLNGINFCIEKGQVCALLGRNGAGKSTFIKLALGLTYPTEGNILIMGEKPGANNSRVGYLSENITLYPHLSAIDNLRVAAYSSNVKKTESEIKNILDKVSLVDVGNKKAKDFSLGMKRRLQVAMTMIKKVDFLILDEPTNGLDVNGMLWLKNYLMELKKTGVAILLASHSIFDLQDIITNYVIFNKGTIAKKGDWDKEKEIVSGTKIIVSSEQINTLAAVLNSKGIEYGSIEKDSFTSFTITSSIAYKEICRLLYENQIYPESVQVLKNSLETVFLNSVKENEE